ncbi:pyridoxamine 5'-phosphate oxidase-domain-containing protein [Microdochium trichocladiopsis]|uniref:Pyridoxamine 5'-phosphate oxidase-domain-containing protein n=1 Tax=Microdochium trichocladiopsis TaxID=1682393 RepID=A0A9P9BS57_9PEZI|nr:pyridoxamine 5'-phosphate oxidase-domain-containing protein [Microdochium trichocladiopsis]KAH7037555.1 pyridoxamine 5'-phosphate oxidase-domain-containing protein [Microdochium trichocladiopsis]
MRFTKALSLVPALASCSTADPVLGPLSHIASNPEDSQSVLGRIPTAHESAVLGRRILALTPLGTLATVFPNPPDGHYSAEERRPAGLGGVPLGLMDYVADCEDEGNPTILAINIATSFKNVRAGSNISLAQAWTPRYAPDKRIKSGPASLWDWIFGGKGGDEVTSSNGADSVPYSAANLPRYSLLGYLEKIEASELDGVSACFVKQHPDAKYWLPGNRIHESEFVRLVVTQVYWIGGFGDRAYIGWIDPADWKSVTRKDWEAVRLPGEKKGWDEWRVEM